MPLPLDTLLVYHHCLALNYFKVFQLTLLLLSYVGCWSPVSGVCTSVFDDFLRNTLLNSWHRYSFEIIITNKLFDLFLREVSRSFLVFSSYHWYFSKELSCLLFFRFSTVTLIICSWYYLFFIFISFLISVLVFLYLSPLLFHGLRSMSLLTMNFLCCSIFIS